METRVKVSAYVVVGLAVLCFSYSSATDLIMLSSILVSSEEERCPEHESDLGDQPS